MIIKRVAMQDKLYRIFKYKFYLTKNDRFTGLRDYEWGKKWKQKKSS